MKILGLPEGARRRLELDSLTERRAVDLVRGRAGYGFTISGRGPCLVSGVLDGGPADQVGLKRGDRIATVNGTDVSKASHEAVVQLIGTCRGPVRLVVLVADADPLADDDEEFAAAERNRLFQKAGVFRTVSDDASRSPPFKTGPTSPAKQRPVSEPDMSRWAQPWNTSTPRLRSEEEEAASSGGDADSVFTDPDEANGDWSVLNMAVVVGYLGSTELSLDMAADSEDECLRAVRGRIRQLGTERDTHTLVIMRVMFDCVRLCDDVGAVLAAFPAESLVLGAACTEDRRFFCLVVTANLADSRHIPAAVNGPVKTSCHVFFIDPELSHHGVHLAVASRFGLDCTPDPDALGCLEFPQAPPTVLHFVSVLYSDMGAAVERLRAALDREGHQQGGGSASSNGDSGVGNASPPEERAERDFPVALGNDPGGHLPSCPWDYLPAPSGPDHSGHRPILTLGRSSHSLSESLPGPDSLTGLSRGAPPRLEFQFKPPPPPPPLGKKQGLTGGGPLRSSQRWFSVRQRWPKGRAGAAETQAAAASTQSWSGSGSLPPPMHQIPADRYQPAEATAAMPTYRHGPHREEWTGGLLGGEQQNGKYRKDGSNTKSSRFWGIGAGRASVRRSAGGAKRLSLARSLDDLESAASSDGDYGGGGGVQLQGCCSQSSLNSNGSLPGASSQRRLSERRVASWAACFERLLQDPVGVRYFSEFLKKEFSEENILFWQACEYFSHVPATDKKQLSQRAGEIYDSFLSSKATTPVNIDSQAQLADDVLTSPWPHMFKAQQLQIFNLMKFDSYSRFLKSSLYQECMLAEVEGRSLPDPYHVPCSPAPSKHSASSDRSGLSTPKKENRKQRSGRSLTEESRDESADKKRGIFFSWSRNRSFGKGPKKKDIGEINLDYWGSNGRRESQGSLSSGASLELNTSCSAGKVQGDNRHSLAAWERVRECSSRHCSVTLSDGSCSSVTLRPGATVREVLRDLCQSLHVNMAAVDLFLVGGDKPLVLDQDCLTLSSRDLRLERRTLFRLDLVPINRSVGLKAKPTKPVTEVLRPVVAKYGLHLNDLVAKISGESEPLDLGAPISSLDGLRVVLDSAEPDHSKAGSSKGHPLPLTSRSPSATGDDRSSGKDGPGASLPVEKRKQKKINIDEAEEFFELLSRAQSSRANDQRGLLNKEDLVLPDFLRLAPPLNAAGLACSSSQGAWGRENGAGGAPSSSRGAPPLLGASPRSKSLDSSLVSSGSNGHSSSSGARRALLPPPRHHPHHGHAPFGAGLSPIPRPSETRAGPPLLRTLEEEAHGDLTLVGEGDISSPNSTLLPPSPTPAHDGSLPQADFTPPTPCSDTSERRPDGFTPATSQKRPPSPGGPRPYQAAAEVMDVEGVRLEEGEEEEEGTLCRSRGEDSVLSLSFHGYAAELRQCQSRMRSSQAPFSARNPPEGKDAHTDIYKATIV